MSRVLRRSGSKQYADITEAYNVISAVTTFAQPAVHFASQTIAIRGRWKTLPERDKPLGQQYHDAVEALKAEGMKNAEAVREVATRFGKQENAIRGGIHQWRSRHGNGQATATRSTRGRRAATPSVDALLASARESLEDALALVESEVHDAKTALEHAQAHYDRVVAGVNDKRADIEQKLRALK